MARGRQKRSRRDESTRDTPDRQAQEIEQLREENERLRKRLEEYAKRIADLERQLALKEQNSTLTSKPPSSDGLAGRQRERGRRVKSRRKARGQPGHPGSIGNWPPWNVWMRSWISRRRCVATARAACTPGIRSGPQLIDVTQRLVVLEGQARRGARVVVAGWRPCDV
jgi:hypothetical protein